MANYQSDATVSMLQNWATIAKNKIYVSSSCYFSNITATKFKTIIATTAALFVSDTELIPVDRYRNEIFLHHDFIISIIPEFYRVLPVLSYLLNRRLFISDHSSSCVEGNLYP